MENIIVMKGSIKNITFTKTEDIVKLEYSAMWHRKGSGAFIPQRLPERNYVDIGYRRRGFLEEPAAFKFTNAECKQFGIPAFKPYHDGMWSAPHDTLHIGDKVVIFVRWVDILFSDGTQKHKIQDVIIIHQEPQTQYLQGLVNNMAEMNW